MSYEKDGINQIEVEELEKLVNEERDNKILIDVREVEEYDQFHIPGVPLIPMNQIPQLFEKMDKEKDYVFICRSGARSQNVALFLKDNGFNHVHNYAGGMLAWQGETAEGPEWIVKDIKEIY
ncbi:rhodanese-like domain-containing protein [Alkalihalobacillus trypoxylicola]|uniref:Sulfurtransferase n=1 Tax=Alkalihalobacillus trypoxylicola TaxID=519424 RepID=A0A162EDY7_9BACI|nr:rhodanese-like domain-containing protein [Alkalihalobacillus trypoxylicola]KYG32355.1 sulfurtransferase [Alkalihalobacillus trypoxylicola]